MLRGLILIPLLLAALPSAAAPQLKTRGLARPAKQAAAYPWQKALQQSILTIQRGGAGEYSTGDDAKQALTDAFVWDERYRRPRFDAKGGRPSFCSGAVYMAVLNALLRWEEGNRRRCISEEAWRALLPQKVKDGVTPWGYANANGPGFAMLIARLGAGTSFTDSAQARPGDIAKIWWTDALGATESGHLVILVKDEGDSLRIWSSNMPRKGLAGGFGLRSVPKSSIRRILYTRITHPEAFNKAPQIADDPWLTQLMSQSTTWEECEARLKK